MMAPLSIKGANHKVQCSKFKVKVKNEILFNK